MNVTRLSSNTETCSSQSLTMWNNWTAGTNSSPSVSGMDWGHHNTHFYKSNFIKPDTIAIINNIEMKKYKIRDTAPRTTVYNMLPSDTPHTVQL